MEISLLANVAEVIAVGFMLWKSDDFFIVQLAQKRDVAFANRAAQIALTRQTFGFAEQSLRRCAFGKTLAQNNALTFHALFLQTIFIDEKRRETINYKGECA